MLGKIFDVISKLCLVLVLGFIGAYCLNRISVTFPEIIIPAFVLYLFAFGYILLKLLED